MNDARTCVYGHARKFGACGERGTCVRPRGLPCLCGLVKARVPEPGPDKLTQQRNEYTSRKASGWTHRRIHTCLGCNEEFDTEHRAAFHVCLGLPREPLPGFNCQGTVTGRLSSHTAQFAEVGMQRAKRLNPDAVMNMDYRHLEERVVAHCTDEASGFTEAMWQSLAELGRCPWDDFKPSKDIA